VNEFGSRITVEDAVPADAEEIAALHARGWRDAYPSDRHGVTREWVADRVRGWTLPAAIRRRRALIAAARVDVDRSYLVARLRGGGSDEDRVVVGFASPWRDEVNQRVGALYVDRGWRGRGVGGELLAEVVAWAAPGRTLALEVATYNRGARAFYRRWGFTEVGVGTCGVIPVVRMELAVGVTGGGLVIGEKLD